MKSILVCLACSLLAMKVWAQSSAEQRFSQAYSDQERAAMSDALRQDLLLRAEKLCWFESIKPGMQLSAHQLTNRDGDPVVLTEAQLQDFNPLMYQLPQQEMQCENLMIQTAEGNQHLLVVRSADMMRKEADRAQVKKNKTATK